MDGNVFNQLQSRLRNKMETFIVCLISIIMFGKSFSSYYTDDTTFIVSMINVFVVCLLLFVSVGKRNTIVNDCQPIIEKYQQIEKIINNKGEKDK